MDHCVADVVHFANCLEKGRCVLNCLHVFVDRCRLVLLAIRHIRVLCFRFFVSDVFGAFSDVADEILGLGLVPLLNIFNLDLIKCQSPIDPLLYLDLVLQVFAFAIKIDWGDLDCLHLNAILALLKIILLNKE